MYQSQKLPGALLSGVALLGCVIAGCASGGGSNSSSSSPPSSRLGEEALRGIDLAPVAGSAQVLLVVAEEDSRHARAWLLERDVTVGSGGGADAFQVVYGPVPACVGANGFAAPGQKREGDKRTPTGAFPLPESYSSDAAFVSKIAHRVVTEQDMICEDPASPQYNRWVTVSGTALPPWTADERDMMELGVIVDYNRDPVVPGAGSGILIHAARPGPSSAGTYGCVGLAKADLRAIVSRLDAAKRPMILMGRRGDLAAVGR